MAAYDTLRAAIDNYIKANGNKEITGTVLNDILNAMVSALGADTRFAGVAVPSTNPGNPEGNVVYFASQAGTYSNFGGIVLPLGIHILVWNGTAWTSQTWFSVDNTPTQNSQNLAISGGILQAIVDAVGVERLRAIGAEVTSCSFDGTTKKISFFNSANTTLFQLDATAFVIDGMVSDVKIEDGNLVIQFNTDAGKQDIEIPLTDIFNPANYYTKTAIDALLALYYTKTETDALLTAINNKLADGCLYRGMAEPTTNPPTPTTKVFYIATKAGTYTNFGNIAVTEGITILKYDGSNWSKEQISYSDGVFDISAYHATGGELAKYADLSAALDSNNGGGVPQSLQKGGMSVKFVQTSDNKYMQARCMAQNFTTDIAQWQGVDDEPVKGSKNLVESSGIEKYLAKSENTVNNPTYQSKAVSIDGMTTDSQTYAMVAPIELKSGETIILNKGNEMYLGKEQSVLFQCDSSGNWLKVLISRDTYGGAMYATNVYFTNTSGSTIYVGTSTYTNQRSYIIQKITVAAPLDVLNEYLKINGTPLGNADARTVNDNIKSASLFNFGSASMVASDNPASSADKVIAKDGFVFRNDTIFIVRLYPSNTADNLTLNINNTGAKNLYYNGERASSTNCWSADELAILTTNGTNYYFTSVSALSKNAIWSLIAKLGVTTSYEQNYFLRELYLTGINTTDTYYLNTITKNDGGAWSFVIRKDGSPSVEVARGRLEASDEKTALVRVSEMNSSGITGYAVVDWTQYDLGQKIYYISAGNLRNEMVSELSFSPTIYAYLKDIETQNSLNMTIQQTAAGLEGEINDVKGLISGNNVGLDVYSIAQNIKSERSYFLNETYANEISYVDTSYLDDKIRNIPEGKHFLFTTDSHIDYYNADLRQRETEIMAYVKTKLNAGCVIFGGDAIGQQDSQYKAAKVLSVYTEDKFNAFGSDFLWCQGNHDANANLVAANKIPSTEIYKRTTGVMKRYGKAVFDDEGISIINGLTLSSEDKAEAIAWMNQHYYYDDDRNKIRFIIVETGDGSNGSYIIGNMWNGYENLIGYITFLGEALQNTPDGYDVVLVLHQLSLSTNFNDGVVTFSHKGMHLLLTLLSAFKTHTTCTVTADGSVTSSKPVLYALMTERIGSGITYDFSNRTSGRCIAISGHFHFDDAWIVQNTNPSSIWNHQGKEYGEWDTVLSDAILAIQTDRACLYEKSSWANPESADHAKAPNSVSYENQSIEGQTGGEQRFGTKNEVLFDVVTITPDNRVVCTRIGAGNDRTYDLPTQS